MSNDRTNVSMDVEFTYPGEDGATEKTSVYVPFPILIEAIRKFFDSNLVKLDGKDNDIWNTLLDLGCDFYELEDNEDIIAYCKEQYKGSSYEEEDFEEWKDEYEMLNNLGEYAEYAEA